MIFNFKDTTDAKTLDGHEAEYFAGAESVKNNSLGYELTEGFDLNNALGKYNSMRSAIISSLLNKPSGVTGEISVEWFPADYVDGKYGLQILRHTSRGIAELYFRYRYNQTWGEWQKVFTTAGGTINGNIEVKSAIANAIKIAVENTKRRITLEVDSGGNGYLWDGTNGKAIASFSADGTNNTFNGTASGNLSLSGGRIKSVSTIPLELQTTGSEDTLVSHLYNKNGDTIGSIGFVGGLPVLRIGTGSWRNIHHDGNSAKTVISNTAPSDTTALWIDTSA